jgi:hypothetical protein
MNFPALASTLVADFCNHSCFLWFRNLAVLTVCIPVTSPKPLVGSNLGYVIRGPGYMGGCDGYDGTPLRLGRKQGPSVVKIVETGEFGINGELGKLNRDYHRVKLTRNARPTCSGQYKRDPDSHREFIIKQQLSIHLLY